MELTGDFRVGRVHWAKATHAGSNVLPDIYLDLLRRELIRDDPSWYMVTVACSLDARAPLKSLVSPPALSCLVTLSFGGYRSYCGPCHSGFCNEYRWSMKIFNISNKLSVQEFPFPKTQNGGRTFLYRILRFESHQLGF